MKAGWKTVKLADVAEMRPPKSEAKLKGLKPTDEVGFLPMEDLTQFQKHAKALKTRTMSEVSNSYTYFANGDVLMAKISPCFQNGKMGIATGLPNGVGYGSSEYFVFRPSKELSAEWLFYYLQDPAFRRHATGKFSGNVGQQRLPKELIEELEIPLPPLAEQKRIVALLDEAFAGIDEAKAKAVDNVLGAKRALQSILETSLSPTAAGWTERKLDDLCVIKGRIGYRGYTKNDLVEKGQGAISLSPSNIKQNRFVADDCTYISWFKYNESPEIMIFEGDILFVKTGSTFGKVAIAKDLPEKATINPQFVVLKEMKCNNWFLYYSMTSNTFREKVEGIVGGAATPTLSQANLGELTIHVPPMRIQETIVNQLDAAHVATTSLGNLYEQKIKSIRELRASLLAQAFAGKLTA